MPHRDEIVSLDDAFAYHINRAYRLLRADFLRRTREAGHELTPEQYFLLNKLWHRPGQSQAELAAELNDRANVTRGLDVLEKHGLIERQADAGDRRRHRVMLSQEGAALVRKLNPVILRGRAEVYHSLASRDLKELRRILAAIERNLQAPDDV
jgi:DNA-binding MarR family transcriptional regulator